MCYIFSCRYDIAHKKARNVIERSFGVLKSRFRCLLNHRVLHYTPATAGQILYACMILHNICIQQNVVLDNYSDYEEAADDDENEDEALPQSGRANIRRVRTAYINRYF